MDYREHIQRAIDYIEENLKYEISNGELARVAGYSEYYFPRIFKEAVGLTPADYVRKRRLTEIVCRLEDGRFLADIAYEYGFNSKENFCRAFKAEHHILPTEYRNARNSLKLYERKCFELPPFRVEGQMAVLEPFRLVVFPCDEKFPPNFWNKYNARHWSEKLSGGAVVEDFGVSFWNDREKRLDYFIGIREEDAQGDRAGTQTLEIAGGEYALFDTPRTNHVDFVNMIHRTWDYIGTVWLPENGYRRTGGYELESYVEKSRKFSERIYIPVCRKESEEGKQ